MGCSVPVGDQTWSALPGTSTPLTSITADCQPARTAPHSAAPHSTADWQLRGGPGRLFGDLGGDFGFKVSRNVAMSQMSPATPAPTTPPATPPASNSPLQLQRREQKLSRCKVSFVTSGYGGESSVWLCHDCALWSIKRECNRCKQIEADVSKCLKKWKSKTKGQTRVMEVLKQ